MLKFKLIWEFMAVLVICKSDEDPIKTECTIVRTRSNMDFFSTQGQESLTWTVWCGWKSNSSKILWLSWLSARLMKIRSKVKLLSSRQHCLHCKSGKNFHRSRASNSKENSLIRPEMELIQDFEAVHVTCKFEEHLIKNEVQATLVNSTMLNSILSLTSKWQPVLNFFPCIFIAIRLCLTRIIANVKLLITRYEFSALTCAF